MDQIGVNVPLKVADYYRDVALEMGVSVSAIAREVLVDRYNQGHPNDLITNSSLLRHHETARGLRKPTKKKGRK